MSEGMDLASPRVMSLCAGYGGLDLAVHSLTNGRTVAYAEVDPHAASVMAHHWPGVPNLGDITAVDWSPWRGRVDYLCAGFPCQDISVAGRGEGIGGKRSGIWKNVAEAVGILGPRLVFLENVAVIRSRGLGTVAEDLAVLGYDLRWTCLRASAVGAPHQRNRWFGVAKPSRHPYGA
jgi:DNA (cytosine-5)-methyltransferase 1